MKIIRSKDFTATRAWGAMTVANMQGITTRLHWTDKPYKWHINEGEEVFAVLDGRVEMRYRDNCGQCSVMLETGDIFSRARAPSTSPRRWAKPVCWWWKWRAATEGSPR